jgi:hypothetical protein
MSKRDGDKLADKQPRDGDAVLHCGHLDAQEHHFFRIPEGYSITFRRPDGTDGEAERIVACRTCFDKADGVPSAIEIRGDGVWKGNDPILYVCDPDSKSDKPGSL